MSEIKEVTAYRFAGTIYETRAAAESAEARANLSEFMARNGFGRGGEWSFDMIFDHLVEHRAEFIRFLGAIK